MQRRQRTRRHDQPAIRIAREGRNRTLDLAGIAHVYRPYVHPDQRRHGLDYRELAYPGGYVGVPKDRRSCHAGDNLLQKLQPFSTQIVFELHKAGSVAARL